MFGVRGHGYEKIGCQIGGRGAAVGCDSRVVVVDVVDVVVVMKKTVGLMIDSGPHASPVGVGRDDLFALFWICCLNLPSKLILVTLVCDTYSMLDQGGI